MLLHHNVIQKNYAPRVVSQVSVGVYWRWVCSQDWNLLLIEELLPWMFKQDGHLIKRLFDRENIVQCLYTVEPQLSVINGTKPLPDK